MARSDTHVFQERITVSIRSNGRDTEYGEVLSRLASYLELSKAVGTHQQWIKQAMFNQFLLENYPDRARIAIQGLAGIGEVRSGHLESEKEVAFHERIAVTIRQGRSKGANADLIARFIETLELYKSMGTLQLWVQQACIQQFRATTDTTGAAGEPHRPAQARQSMQVSPGNGEGETSPNSVSKMVAPEAQPEPSPQPNEQEALSSEPVPPRNKAPASVLSMM